MHNDPLQGQFIKAISEKPSVDELKKCGAQIKALLKTKGISQENVSDHFKRTRQTICNHLNVTKGVNNTTIAWLSQIANFVNNYGNETQKKQVQSGFTNLQWEQQIQERIELQGGLTPPELAMEIVLKIVDIQSEGSQKFVRRAIAAMRRNQNSEGLETNLQIGIVLMKELSMNQAFGLKATVESILISESKKTAEIDAAEHTNAEPAPQDEPNTQPQ